MYCNMWNNNSNSGGGGEEVNKAIQIVIEFTVSRVADFIAGINHAV